MIIVYMTAYGDPQTFTRALASEFTSAIRKPFEQAELQRVLENAFNRWGVL